jgi:hypothetical protein
VGKKRVFMVATLTLVGVVVFGGTALAGTMLTATLTGAAERPGPGDRNGSGTADLDLMPTRERICYTITVNNIAPATDAHIHRGSASEAGPIVKTLKPPTDGSSSGCVRSGRMLIRKIKNNPSGYYVNVHNEDFPSGAVRGQLTPSP